MSSATMFVAHLQVFFLPKAPRATDMPIVFLSKCSDMMRTEYESKLAWIQSDSISSEELREESERERENKITLLIGGSPASTYRTWIRFRFDTLFREYCLS